MARKPVIVARKPPDDPRDAFVAAGSHHPSGVRTVSKKTSRRPEQKKTSKRPDATPTGRTTLVRRIRSGLSLERKTLYLPPAIATALARAAFDTHRSESDITTEALRKLLGMKD